MAGNGRKTSRVSHSSLERTACDKCRCQKLRCVRDKLANNHALSACRRCVNAGVVCVTSPAKPLRRHSIRQTEVASDIPLETSHKARWEKCVHQKGSEDIQVPHNRPLGLRPPGPESSSQFSPPLPIAKHQQGTLSESDGAETNDLSIPHQAEGANYAVKSGIGTIEIQYCRLNLSLSQLVVALRTGTESDRDLRNRILDISSALLGSDENSQKAQTSPIKLVLDSTSEFLSILQQCSQALQNHGSPNTDPGNGLHQISQEKTEVYGPSKHAEVWIFHAFMPPASQEFSKSNSTSMFTKRQIAQPLSTSTILNLASCYFHFIAIYDILFHQIRLVLDETSPPFKSLQSIGDLKIAGSRVQDSGLQVKILVKIVEHQLELIEKVLGLPDQYRLRPRSHQHPRQTDGQQSPECKGILDELEAQAFLESAMKLNDQAGTLSILSLRQNVDRVLEVTKTLQ